MGILSSSPPRRLRAGRARRRVFFLAELLETRQLLSVASFHATIPPIAHAPALVGPAVPSPVSGVGTTGTTTSTTPQVLVIFEVFQAGSSGGGGNGVPTNLFVVEESFSSGTLSGGISTATPSQASTSPSSGANAGGSAAGSTSITPLTAAILAGPAAANRAQVVVIVQQQPLAVNLAPSTISVTTQAILLTATQEEQPIPPPVLGQGFESPAGQGSEFQPDTDLQGRSIPARIELQPLPASDYIEPIQPIPADPAPAAPAQPQLPPAAETAERVSEPVEAVLAGSIAMTEWGKQPDLPLLTPRIEIRANEEYPTWSLATMVGTAAVASGGYQLLLGGSDRFNQRWIPTRRSSRRDRMRRSADSE